MDATQIIQIIWAMVVGMVSGAVANGMGYFKGTTIEKFSKEKLFVTIFVGAVVGALAGYFGMSYADAFQFVVYIGGNVGSIYVLENMGKIVYRRFIKPYVDSRNKKKSDDKDDKEVEKKDEEE